MAYELLSTLETYLYIDKPYWINLSDFDDYLNDKLTELEEISKTHLSFLQNITHFDYYNNNAKNLEWLKYFPNVTYINYQNNNVNTFSWIKYTPKIQEIICENNKIISINGLEKAYHLTIFRGANNLIGQILNLSLENIIIFNVDNCYLTEFTIISAPNLQELYCTCNAIIKFEIANANQLKYLYCSNNFIQEIKGLKHLESLEVLFCDNNQLVILDLPAKSIDHLVCCDNLLIDVREKYKHLKISFLICDE